MFSRSSKNFLSSTELRMFLRFWIEAGLLKVEILKGFIGPFCFLKGSLCTFKAVWRSAADSYSWTCCLEMNGDSGGLAGIWL